MYSIPSVFQWKALYNQLLISDSQSRYIFTVADTPYLIIDGFYQKWKMFTHCFLVILLADGARRMDAPLMLGCANMMRLIRHLHWYDGIGSGKQYDVTTHCQETQHKNQQGCLGTTFPRALLWPWHIGWGHCPLLLHKRHHDEACTNLKWCDVGWHAVCRHQGACPNKWPCRSSVTVHVPDTIRGLYQHSEGRAQQHMMSEAICHPMCTYKHSMHISPLYSMNDTVFNIVFGALFCNGGLFIILFISS